MPSPIRKVTDQDKLQTPLHESQLLRIVIPMQQYDPMALTDAEADFLYAMWKGAAPGSKVFSSKGMDTGHIFRLKDKGYLQGPGQDVELTAKGKKLIIEMVTNEPNSFLKQAGSAKDVQYREVRAKKEAAKRPRQTHTGRKKTATAKCSDCDCPYGTCPHCGQPGIMTERRPDGDSQCANGHSFPRQAQSPSGPKKPYNMREQSIKRMESRANKNQRP